MLEILRGKYNAIEQFTSHQLLSNHNFLNPDMTCGLD